MSKGDLLFYAATLDSIAQLWVIRNSSCVQTSVHRFMHDGYRNLFVIERQPPRREHACMQTGPELRPRLINYQKAVDVALNPQESTRLMTADDIQSCVNPGKMIRAPRCSRSQIEYLEVVTA